MVLSRIFHETDAKGREHINKQYIQEYDIKPFSEYVTFLTTRNREKPKEMTREEAENGIFTMILTLWILCRLF